MTWAAAQAQQLYFVQTAYVFLYENARVCLAFREVAALEQLVTRSPSAEHHAALAAAPRGDAQRAHHRLQDPLPKGVPQERRHREHRGHPALPAHRR